MGHSSITSRSSALPKQCRRLVRFASGAEKDVITEPTPLLVRQLLGPHAAAHSFGLSQRFQHLQITPRQNSMTLYCRIMNMPYTVMCSGKTRLAQHIPAHHTRTANNTITDTCSTGQHGASTNKHACSTLWERQGFPSQDPGLALTHTHWLPDLQLDDGRTVLLLLSFCLQAILLRPEELLLQVFHHPQHLLQLCILTLQQDMGASAVLGCAVLCCAVLCCAVLCCAGGRVQVNLLVPGC